MPTAATIPLYFPFLTPPVHLAHILPGARRVLGPPILHPVNLPASSAVRERFSSATFGQTVRDMAPYWNDRYFHGTRPPPTLASEEAVLLFLRRTPGSVGYLPEGLVRELPPEVRLLLCER